MPAYEIKIVFESDRELDPEEIAMIEGACLAQVSEPVDENGDDMDVNVLVNNSSNRKIS